MNHADVMHGTLVRGKGEAAGFTGLDWVRAQTLAHAGIDPFPGTFNLRLAAAADIEAWAALRTQPGHAIDPPEERYCRARCYPMRVNGAAAAAIVPEVPGYPEDTVELVSAVGLREHLGAQEGDRLRLDPWRPLPVRAVMFDVDGTLADSIDAYFEIARVAAEPRGYAVTMEHVRTSLATGRSFWRGVVPEDAPDRESVIKAMSAHARSQWPRVLREHLRLHEGLRELFETLTQRGVKLGIVTAAHGDVVDLMREAGLTDYFSAIVTGLDVARRKPDPEGLLLCLDKLGVAAAEAVYVGDTPLDVAASLAARVHALAVLTGAGDSASLTRAGAHRVMATLATLPALVL